MIAVAGELDLHIVQAGVVEEMAGKFAAGSWQVWAVDAVLRQGAPDPPLWTEHDRNQNHQGESEIINRHIANVAQITLTGYSG